MLRYSILAWILLFATVSPSLAYIAVSATRLTLCEVMLEFPTILLLELERVDEQRGAFSWKVVEALQGEKPAKLKMALLEGNQVPARLRGMTVGTQAVAFLGSPDDRSLMVVKAGWFLTKPDQGWERFTQFRDDFRALFADPPAELAAAIRTLRRGGKVTVPVRPEGVQESERLYVQFDADFPHRRTPSLPVGLRISAEQARQAAQSSSVVQRQQAYLALGETTGEEMRLLKGLSDGHSEVRLAATYALGKQAKLTIEAVRQLAKRLDDDDRFVCAFAAWGLGRAGEIAKSALPNLERALGDRDANFDFRPHRAAEAAEAILRLAPSTPSAERAVQFFLSDRMLQDQRIDSEGTRTAAARALGRSGASAAAALPKLVKAMEDSVAATRIAAAEAVILVGGDAQQRQRAEAVLAAELERGELATRIQAIRAVVSTRSQALRPKLQALATSRDPDLQREANQAIGRLQAK